MEEASKQPNKRAREVAPRLTEADIMYYANRIMERNDSLPTKHQHRWPREGSKEEDRDTREFFGGNATHILQLWNLLINTGYLPDGGTVDHLLWCLLFCKVYARRKTLCSLAGCKSKNTYMKWVTKFLDAIANCEPYVVSCLYYCIVFIIIIVEDRSHQFL